MPFALLPAHGVGRGVGAGGAPIGGAIPPIPGIGGGAAPGGAAPGGAAPPGGRTPPGGAPPT